MPDWPSPHDPNARTSENVSYAHAGPYQSGEIVIVPRGVEHRPSADDETAILLFEPLGVRNTGNVTHATLTAPVDERL
jgi:hypothetical protein